MRGALAFVVACLASALAGWSHPPSAVQARGADFPGWPRTFDGLLLVPLETGPKEQRLYRDFPGRVGRFSDGRREIVLRWVDEPTHLLHPAETCFRGLGFTIEPRHAVLAGDGRMTGVFRATRGEETLEVREWIYDEDESWSDLSAWYWAATLGRARGPWWAVMVVETRSSDAARRVSSILSA